jgi:hypothetical protein
LPNRSSGFIFVGNSAANELVAYGVWRTGENRDPSGHTAVKQIGRFKRPGAIGITRHDYDVGGFDRIISDQRPSSRAQNRSSNGGYSDRAGTDDSDEQPDSGQ